MSDMSRLRWLCRRGMKELDVILGAYLERFYASATDAEQLSFRRLLEMPDPELYRLLLGHDEALDESQQALVLFLRGISARR